MVGAAIVDNKRYRCPKNPSAFGFYSLFSIISVDAVVNESVFALL